MQKFAWGFVHAPQYLVPWHFVASFCEGQTTGGTARTNKYWVERHMHIRVVLAPSVWLFGACSPAYGQAGTPEREIVQAVPAAQDEIIVTARRREESLTAVPVAITAMTQQELKRAGISDFRSLSSALPTLKTSEATSGAGGSIYIRGVGTTGGISAGLDQGVSINVDGVQFSRGSILRLGLYDAAQIQVLRGPQALFFGKNSPAGIISITTADPGDRFELSGQGSYEFTAREWIGQVAASAPLTDTLGVRVVVNGSRMKGYFINDAGRVTDAINAIRPNTAFTVGDDRAPNRRSIFARGTVKFDPSDLFDARLKISYSSQHQDNISDIKQKIVCPYGASQVGTTVALLGGNAALTPLLAIDDCKPNRHYTHGTLPSGVAALAPGRSTPDDLAETSIFLTSLEMNVNPTPEIKVTSVTGYESTTDDLIDNYSWNPAYLPLIVFNSHTKDHSFTQELRLATSFADSPVNVLVGGFYQDAKLSVFNYNSPSGAPRFDQDIGTRALSVFGQGIWNITDTVELSGGARYSSERKTFAVARGGVGQPTRVPKRTFHDLSPELTLTYRPSRTMTFYGSFKEGFKSGGYNPRYNSGGPIAAPGDDVSFDQERVRGGEIGAKSELLDRSLRLSATAYSYKYSNLQVTSIDNSGLVAVIRIQNAAAARVKGLEFDANLAPRAIPGLRLASSINYTDARYLSFISPCFTGQTIAEGCNLLPDATTGRFTSQDLGGERLTNSAPWSMTFGASYELPAGAGWMLGVAADTKYEGAYNPLPERDPLVRQADYWMLNASVRAFAEDGRWELALIGRNLTNVYRAVESASASLTGTASRTGTATPGGRADYTGNVIRPRSIMAQVTVKY